MKNKKSRFIWNFKLSDLAQGFLLGLGLVFTLYGFISMKYRKA